ncbi:WD40 repeat domain-containing protein [bacterium AH-315-F18]|nr:WD40 repeat domain-containing protein [bacterium AH-315-F18]
MSDTRIWKWGADGQAEHIVLPKAAAFASYLAVHLDGAGIIWSRPEGRVFRWSGKEDENVEELFSSPLSMAAGKGKFRALALIAHPRPLAAATYVNARNIVVWDPVTGQEVARLLGHTGPVQCMTFSSDGRRLASGTKHAGLKVWDIPSRTLLADLKGHTETIHDLAFSKDASRLVSTAHDGTLRIWHAASGRQQMLMPLPDQDALYRLALNGSGDTVAFSGDSGVLHVWRIDQHPPRLFFGDLPGGSAVAFSGDDDQLRVVGTLSMLLADGKTGMPQHFRPFEVSIARRAAIDVKRNVYVHGGSDRAIRLVSFEDHRVIAKYQSDGPRIGALAVDAKSGDVVFSGKDHTIARWRPGSDSLTAVFKGHKKKISLITLDHEGKWMASTSSEPMVLLWAFDDVSQSPSVLPHPKGCTSMAFARGTETLITGGYDGVIRFFKSSTGEETGRWKVSDRSIRGVAVNVTNDRLAYTTGSGLIHIRSFRAGKALADFQAGPDAFYQLAFNPDGTRLVTLSHEGAYRIWRIKDGHELGRWPDAATTPHSVRLSRDGNLLYPVSRGLDGSFVLRDHSTGSRLPPFVGHKEKMHSFILGPNHERMASWASTKAVLLWNVTDSSMITRVEQAVLSTFVFDDTGKLLATGDGDGVRVIDARTGAIRFRSKVTGGTLTALTFSPDSQWVGLSTKDRKIHVLSTTSGETRGVLEGHKGRVALLVFGPSGKQLASRAEDEVLIWDMAGMKRLPMTDGEARNRCDYWLQMSAQTPPALIDVRYRLKALPADSIAWRTAWMDKKLNTHGLPEAVEHLMTRWERDLGLHVRLDTGEQEHLAAPGAAYFHSPYAERCKER